MRTKILRASTVLSSKVSSTPTGEWLSGSVSPTNVTEAGAFYVGIPSYTPLFLVTYPPARGVSAGGWIHKAIGGLSRSFLEHDAHTLSHSLFKILARFLILFVRLLFPLAWGTLELKRALQCKATNDRVSTQDTPNAIKETSMMGHTSECEYILTHTVIRR